MSESAASEIASDPFSESVYAELKRLAHRQLTVHDSPTLSTTELVHEAYLKLAGPAPADWHTRAHFFGSAAHAMRQVLIDHARQRLAAKRGSNPSMTRVTGNDAAIQVELD